MNAAEALREEGRIEGLNEGRNAAEALREEGRIEGLNEGRNAAEALREEGRNEGRSAAVRQHALKLLEEGLNYDLISRVTDLSEAELDKIAREAIA